MLGHAKNRTEAILTLNSVANTVHDERMDFQLATDFISVCARMTASEAVVKRLDGEIRQTHQPGGNRRSCFAATTHRRSCTKSFIFVNQEINQIASEGGRRWWSPTATRRRRPSGRTRLLNYHSNRLLAAPMRRSALCQSGASGCQPVSAQGAPRRGIFKIQHYDATTLDWAGAGATAVAVQDQAGSGLNFRPGRPANHAAALASRSCGSGRLHSNSPVRYHSRFAAASATARRFHPSATTFSSRLCARFTIDAAIASPCGPK